MKTIKNFGDEFEVVYEKVSELERMDIIKITAVSYPAILQISVFYYKTSGRADAEFATVMLTEEELLKILDKRKRDSKGVVA